MDAHRRAASTSVDVVPIGSAFSCFDYVQDHFDRHNAIHRCFSLGRSFDMRMVTIEDIAAQGFVEEENVEIKAYYPDHQMTGLKRLAFWRKPFASAAAIPELGNDDLIGYAIAKKDHVPSCGTHRWHIYEAGFRKYPHPHNCVPGLKSITVRVSGKEFDLPAVVYCQQNGLNKACAHVAVRSLLSRHVKAGDVSYRRINEIAAKSCQGTYSPKDGLDVPQIRAIFRETNIAFRDIDYVEEEKTDKAIRDTHPFQKFLYSGIESGCGGLLGFRLAGPKAQLDRKHIIPFFGHTFNKDTWVPDADIAYFNVGGGVGYIPSESWTSSFLGHDDNFGPNFCVPRLYVRPEQADYVVELLKDAVQYSGAHAEAVAIPFLYSLYPTLASFAPKEKWLRRMATWAHPKMQKAILRAVAIARDEYLRDLASVRDWDGHGERADVVEVLQKLLPEILWVVEVSIPQLFPANERKVGDVILNPLITFDENNPVDFKLLLLVRVPGHYFFVESVAGDTPTFVHIPSQFTSHIPLLKA